MPPTYIEKRDNTRVFCVCWRIEPIAGGVPQKLVSRTLGCNEMGLCTNQIKKRKTIKEKEKLIHSL